MLIKTSELKDQALDYAVNLVREDKREKYTWPSYFKEYWPFKPSTDWAHGGPLLERYVISVEMRLDSYVGYTNKYWWQGEEGTDHRSEFVAQGDTYLVAAMRVLVLAKLGPEIDVPEELLS